MIEGKEVGGGVGLDSCLPKGLLPFFLLPFREDVGSSFTGTVG
jgi:hypothetical protein